MHIRQTRLLQTLMFASALSSTSMLYTGFGIFMNTEAPIVVVLSGSMEPAFQRGDLLFLTNPPAEQYRTGDIVVYRVPGAHIPIVHRVIEARDIDRQSSESGTDENDLEMEIEDPDRYLELSYRTGKAFIQAGRPTTLREAAGDQLLLTKGDNNPTDDIVLYNGLDRLQRKHIIGKVRGFVPYIGYISIVLNNMPRLIYAGFKS